MPDMIEAIPAATSSSEVNPSESASSAGCHKARVDLGDITPHNIKLLKKVNQASLGKPVLPAFFYESKKTMYVAQTEISLAMKH